MSQQTMEIMRECIPTFFILSDENRHKILELLQSQGPMNVNGLTERLHLSRPAISHHLKLMLVAGMVQVEQQGKERYYSAALDYSIALLQRLLASLGSCEHTNPD